MKILLVDDDSSVIQALLPTLKALPGHEILVALTGPKALENAQVAGGLDLLITDVVMEPTDGFTLREELARSFPGLQAIFISGYDLSEYADRVGTARLLSKPFDPQELVQAVQAVEAELLASASAGGVAAAAPAPAAAAARPRSARIHPAPQASPAIPASGDPMMQGYMIGQMIGGYQIVSQLGEGRWGTVYAAVQTAINRPVGLKVLDPERAREETVKQRFIADARTKAHVQHPSILSVYEAGSADGWIFYTHEYVDGQNLGEMATAGRTLDEQVALKILRVAAEGLLYLNKNGIPHTQLMPGDIYLGVEGQIRMANLATQFADQQPSVPQQIDALGRAVSAVLPAHGITAGLRTFLSRTQHSSPTPIATWGTVLQALKALEPKVVPVEAAKISAQDRAAIEAVEKARKQQKRAFMINVASMVSLLLLAGLSVWWFLLRSNERTEVSESQIHIPAGEFTTGDGRTVNVADFWIDQHEVTIGQYAKFVEWLEANPNDRRDYDHPKQPRFLEHIPQYWHIYYPRAARADTVRTIPIDLNCPMLELPWWSAYAYAKWRKRDLPTKDEWEKAARGTKGFKYPWGDEMDTKKANVNADHNPMKPNAKGTVDGFNFWSPVDRLKDDRSPYGVIGMAGNVSEWTASWTADNTFPIIKGGNFSRDPMTMDQQIENIEADKAYDWLGFRTISRKPPQ